MFQYFMSFFVMFFTTLQHFLLHVFGFVPRNSIKLRTMWRVKYKIDEVLYCARQNGKLNSKWVQSWSRRNRKPPHHQPHLDTHNFNIPDKHSRNYGDIYFKEKNFLRKKPRSNCMIITYINLLRCHKGKILYGSEDITIYLYISFLP